MEEEEREGEERRGWWKEKEGGRVDDKLVHFVPLRECRWCLGEG